jgi:hypothetical protein
MLNLTYVNMYRFFEVLHTSIISYFTSFKQARAELKPRPNLNWRPSVKVGKANTCTVTVCKYKGEFVTALAICGMSKNAQGQQMVRALGACSQHFPP